MFYRTANSTRTHLVLLAQAKDISQLIFDNVDTSKNGKIVSEDLIPFFDDADRKYAFELLDKVIRIFLN
jgi:hypothetical protein